MFFLFASSLLVHGSLLELIDTVNSWPNGTWTAGTPYISSDHATSLCGTYLKDDPRYVSDDLPIYKIAQDDVAGTVPDSLDLRDVYPECSVIKTIRDQSACGSCWAFSSVESFEDRRCIATGQDLEFSAFDVAVNSAVDVNGCKGGQPSLALAWMAKSGVVTGGDYADNTTGKTCLPYPLPPCAHHTPATTYPECGAEYSFKRRVTTCSDHGYNRTYQNDKVKGSKAVRIAPRDTNSALSALQTGTVSAGMTIYEDFLTYKSGVYKHVSGRQLGGHAVALIGYGSEGGTDYWLVKNSWNELWGDGGTFKIARGSNECDIEEYLAFIEI